MCHLTEGSQAHINQQDSQSSFDCSVRRCDNPGSVIAFHDRARKQFKTFCEYHSDPSFIYQWHRENYECMSENQVYNIEIEAV